MLAHGNRQSSRIKPATLGLAQAILLDADPLGDIANTSRIRAVVANGRLLDRAELDRLLAKVKSLAAASTSK